jgi:hypothetical protein
MNRSSSVPRGAQHAERRVPRARQRTRRIKHPDDDDLRVQLAKHTAGNLQQGREPARPSPQPPGERHARASRNDEHGRRHDDLELAPAQLALTIIIATNAAPYGSDHTSERATRCDT